MVYSKPAYGPTASHSPNQQIHAYKNSNVNKICIADINSLAQWSFKDCFCLIHHFHIAHVHLPSCLECVFKRDFFPSLNHPTP